MDGDEGAKQEADRRDADKVRVNLVVEKARDIGRSGVENRSLCDKGGRLRIAFKVELHGVEALLTVEGITRNVWTGEPGTSQASIYHHGVEFVDLDPNDRMILQSLVYQNMIENPQNLI